MIESGWILYVLVAAIVYMLGRRSHKMSFEELLKRSGHEHEPVRNVDERYPRGGTLAAAPALDATGGPVIDAG